MPVLYVLKTNRREQFFPLQPDWPFINIEDEHQTINYCGIPLKQISNLWNLGYADELGLAQVAYQALKKDQKLRQWYKRIKRRRGSSIARVAVMRKLATLIWHMLTKKKTYTACRALATA
jgi:hypothetical protein